MKNAIQILFIIFAALISLGVFATQKPSVKPKEPFTLTLPGFTNGDSFKKEYINANIGGKNISPKISWKNAPKETKSFALTCIDTNPVARRWVHWMVLNIPKNVSNLPRKASLTNMPKGCKELNNSFGDKGYGGPQPPPKTGIHKYLFTLYALNVTKINPPKKSLSEQDFLNLIKNKVLAKTSFTLTYSC